MKCLNCILFRFVCFFFEKKIKIFSKLPINFSIVGLYSTFIILIAQFVRGLFIGQQSKIIYEELPNVDKLMQLLNDILLVRSANLFDLETELYDKLVHIHRDPNVLIQITREEDDTNSKKLK